MTVLAVSGCAVKRRNIQDAQAIPDGSGVIVARVVLKEQNVSMRHDDIELTAIKDSNLTVASLIVDVQSGETFRVMTLPAGEYTWRGFYVGTKHSEFRGLLPFEVKPGKVNYIGDIVISINWDDPWHYGMRVMANPPAAESYMRRVYPQLTARYPLVASLTVDKR
jgi:hypothetical protein